MNSRFPVLFMLMAGVGCLPAALRPQFAAAQATTGAEEGIPKNARITAVLEPFVKRHEVAGAVTLVANKDKVLAVDAVGFADVGAKRPIQRDSLFWIASQSKTLTTAALMILVDEGKVSLGDPVEKYLPEYADVWLAKERDAKHMLLVRPARKITIRDILSHTSGLPFRSAAEPVVLDLLPLDVAVRSYAVTPLDYEPGKGYRYSNAGINTAGRIIEIVSGMPYETFMRRRLFEPLGMNDTVIRPTPAQLRRLAKGYRPNAAKNDLEETTITQLTYPLDHARRQPMPAGGFFSTADDVGRFCRMLLNDGMWEGKQILSSAAVAEMSKRQTPPELKESYGLGCSVTSDTFGHGGAMATNMTINKKLGLVTVYLVQHHGFPGKGGQAQGEFRKAAETEFGK